MEIKEGMYVRTNTGIHKIFRIDEHKSVWKYCCDKKETGEWDGSYEYTPIKEEQFIGEPSFDIIDLVQAGDYVNGEKIINLDLGTTGKTIRLFTSESYINIEDIKSIVTKEQFEQMEYKL